MKRLLRILLAATGMLAIVAVGAVVYVTTFLDPEDFKPRLTAVVEEHTGLQLALNGPLSWSFYPRIGVSVEQAQAWMPGREGEGQEFAAIRQAEVSLAFAPLLRGEIAVDGLTLEGLRLNLKRDAEGNGNWEPLLDRLAGQGEEAEAVLAPASAGPHADAGNLDVVLSIANVQFKDADIRFRDEVTNKLYHLQKLNVSGSNVNPVRAFPLKAMFTLVTHNRLDAEMLERIPDTASDINLETRMKLALADQRYILESINLTSQFKSRGQENAQQLKLRAAEIVVDAENQQLSIDEGVLDGGFHHPENWQGNLAMSLAFALEVDWDAATVQLQNLQLTGPDGLRMGGHLNLKGLRENPQYSGQLNAAPFNLRPWLRRAGVELDTASEAALSDVALTSPLQGDTRHVELSGLSLVVDETTLTGQLQVGLQSPRLGFALEGDQINLDNYLPHDAPDESQAVLGGMLSRAYAQAPSSLSTPWLSPLALNGRLTMQQLTLGGLAFTDTTLALEGEAGLHRMTEFQSDFYGGQLQATGELDSRETPIRWSLNPDITRVQVAPLFEAMGEENSPLRGRIDLQGELTTRGNSRESLERYLNGELDARLSEGAIMDINIPRQVCEFVAQLEGEGTVRDWHSDTRFDRFDATFFIRNGVITSDDLVITLPGIEMRGEGDLDLSTQRFHARAAAHLDDTADAACRVNPRLSSIQLPILCEGQLSDAQNEWCRFDGKAFQQNVVGILRGEASQRGEELIQERLDDAVKELDGRLGEGAAQELRDGLRSLFD
ncbi:AsmA family protein [Halomonas sp. Bachu 37]|uniref:AsmA family protein n=1 Tax=Halomonas kashgarensis TaxID=3084920 RepID=UPI0032163ADD